MNDTILYFEFTGQDYSKLTDAAKSAVAFRDENRENLISLSTETKKKILEKYLDSVNPDKLIVNKAKENKNDVRKLYTPDFNGESYFAGVAGVIQGSILLKGEDFPDELEPEQTYQCRVKLQIQSRLDQKEEKVQGKPYFLSTLLLKDSLKLNDDTVPNSEDELYDYLLLFWFKEQLQNAYLKGFFRTYRRFEKNDDRLKGSIDIARHIRMNMGQNNGKIAYSYRENTANNYLNHIIVAAYLHLKKKYYDLVMENFDNNFSLKSIINQLRNEIGYSDLSSYSLIAKNMKPIAHPYYTEYEELRKTCVKILRDEGISIFDSTDPYESKGILYYLPDLWEKYLKSLITAVLYDSNTELLYQKTKKVFEHNGAYRQKTIPDYLFRMRDTQEEFLILDAKFKPKWEGVLSSTGASPISHEILDDYDKCIRDMTTINAIATGVIFPTNKNVPITENILCHRISAQNGSDLFYTLPVYIPYSSEMLYSEWRKKLQESTNVFMNCLQKAVKREADSYPEVAECHKRLAAIRDKQPAKWL